MRNEDFKNMMADMCLAWIRSTNYACWSEERTVAAMLEMIERGYAWFECQQVGTMAFETGYHVPMGSA
jgi:hypothetical protein